MIKTEHKEWTNKYNPFNSWKNLVHSAHYEKILEAEKDNSEQILPPIIINYDLTNVCNYNCNFCMFANRERTDPSGKDFRESRASIPKGHSLTLPKLWKEWGVKAVCMGGGGDPTCHSDFYPMMKEIKKYNLDLGIPSNGYLIDNEQKWIDINNSCKWIGFSIDAGNETDYEKTKGVPGKQFYKVIDNLKGLAKTKKNLETKLDIGYKFLIEDTNYKGIYDAIKIASKIGCNTIQIRPAISPTQVKLFRTYGDEIFEQIEKGRKYETKDFSIMGVTHKFKPNMEKKHDFEKCRATMLSSTWTADGKVYMCTDTRGNDWANLGDHYPNPENFIEWWGSQEHWDKVNKINHKENCDRCTLCAQNEYFEKVFIDDKMERNLI